MKLEYPKEWLLQSADIEGEAEIGAGIPPWNPETPTAGETHSASRIAFGRFVELWRRDKGWNSERKIGSYSAHDETVLPIQ